MKNFYFRSKLLVFFMLGILILSGCSYYPAITPVDKDQQVNVDASNLANVDIEGSNSNELEMEQLNSGSEPGKDSVSENINSGVPSEEIASKPDESLNIDFEEQPILDLTEAEQDLDSNFPIQEQEDDNSKHIAITFDDGPDLNYTVKILDILKDKGVKATFFIVGIQIKKYPEVVQRIVDEGHLIANHTYNHPNLNSLSKEKILEELDTTDDLIESIVGFRPVIVRPPYGAMNDKVKSTIEESGRVPVLWNIDPRDWDSTPVNKMYDNIMNNAKNEGNILFHSFGGKQINNTVELLPKIIDALSEEGYRFVTVDYFINHSE